ncbi:MAG: DUF362 domain-containing protein [Planctomycetota bacterium]
MTDDSFHDALEDESNERTSDDRCTDLPPLEAEPISRRKLILAGSLTAATVAAGPTYRHMTAQRAPVFVARHQRYDRFLTETIREGLLLVGVESDRFRGKKVLLKPNLVEPSREIPHMTTHPSVIVAAAEVFRQWGATVKVGEAPGHVRDTEMALVESGVAEALGDAKLEFADLNYEKVGWVPNRSKVSPLDGLYLPQSVLEADLVVSMPKMKTHHWVGVTASMKNLYGVLPGIKYGWPKNVLHHAGIPQTVIDINASMPSLVTIVDGITCMEGDGPILGTAKQMGLILVGRNLPAVDATMARIMGLRPERVSYLQLAQQRLGPIHNEYIEQRGESWEPLVNPFKVMDRDHLRGLVTDPSVLLS